MPDVSKEIISIVIPAYNEADSIKKVLSSLQPYLINPGFEVIIINDGSQDDTEVIIKNEPKVNLINHPYNKGYGAALKSGIRKASGKYILMMDSDGQHRIEDIPKLIAEKDTYQMIVGARKKGTQEWVRKPGKWLLRVVSNYLSGMDIPDINSGFRLVEKERLLEFMHIFPNGFSFSTTATLALLHAGYNVKFIPIDVMQREGGKSYVRQGRDGTITLLLITRCISLFNPLKVYIPTAITILIPSLLYAIYNVLFHLSFPKTSVVGFLTGVLLIFFGIISDQIAAIRRER